MCQVATRARLGKMLKVVDPDSLEECHRLATLAQLDQQMLGQVQQLQAGAESLQAALVAVQQCQRQQLDGDAAVLADLQAELSASLRRVEGLCKPGEREACRACIAAQLASTKPTSVVLSAIGLNCFCSVLLGRVLHPIDDCICVLHYQCMHRQST